MNIFYAAVNSRTDAGRAAATADGKVAESFATFIAPVCFPLNL
jgi:hypothetical protein